MQVDREQGGFLCSNPKFFRLITPTLQALCGGSVTLSHCLTTPSVPDFVSSVPTNCNKPLSLILFYFFPLSSPPTSFFQQPFWLSLPFCFFSLGIITPKTVLTSYISIILRAFQHLFYRLVKGSAAFFKNSPVYKKTQSCILSIHFALKKCSN